AIGVTGGLGVALAALHAHRAGEGAERVRAEADRIRAARPTAVNLAWAVDRVVARAGAGPAAVQTHCNAGGLACVEWGTALGIVRALHERGAVREVYADETRPLLQG